MARTVVVILSVALLSTGCTSRQLRQSTVRQSESLGDIYEQQVLDNLAKFVVNSEALPDFAVPNEGAARVTDAVAQGGTTLAVGGGAPTAAAIALPNVGRSVDLSWTLDPIRNPHKLKRMRCVYQLAVAGCGVPGCATPCTDCNKILHDFYGDTGHPCFEFPSGWFRCGSKKDVPHDSKCLPVGHYCGTYVWVCPEHRRELTELVLAILDFAFHDSHAESAPTKEVTAYFNEKGKLVEDQNKAAIVVKATFALSEELKKGNTVLIEDLLLTAAQKPVKEVSAPTPTLNDRDVPRTLNQQQRLRVLGGSR